MHKARRAIVVVDVVESVRLMQADEAGVIDRWRRFVAEVRNEVLPAHAGRLVKSLGDGMLLEFEGVPTALAAALDVQQRIGRYNVADNAASALFLRIGVHLADVLVDELDLYGSGVNLAARLGSLAGPGEIVVSDEVHAATVPGLDPAFEDLGPCHVKHLPQPLRAFRLRGAPGSPAGSWMPPPAAVLDELPLLAVLPFEHQGGDVSAVTLADLLSDSLVRRLCGNHHVRIVSRLSTQALRGRDLALATIGSLLGARYVLNGRMHHVGGRFVASAELADTRSGEVLWAGRAGGVDGDLLQPDDACSHDLAQAALQALAEVELRRVRTMPLPTLEGHAMQVGASMLMHRPTVADFLRARDVLEHLIERHPRAASPRAWLAQWHVLRGTRGLTDAPAAEAALAMEQTRRALDADPNDAFAQTMEAFAYCHLLGDLDAAEQRIEQALATNPNEALAWLVRCVVQGFRDQGDAAWVSAQRALVLSPLDPQRHYFDALAASAAVAAHRLDDAVALAERALCANRNHLPTLRALTVAQAERGELQAARLSAARVLELEPGFTLRAYAARGPRGAEATRRRYVEAMRMVDMPN